METTIGKRIAAARREKHLTQEQLASMLEVSPQAVSKWENNQACPDITLLPRLAKILGVSVDALLSGEEAPTVQVLSPEERKDMKEMMLRIIVEGYDGDKVRINLPMALVSAALELGMEFPQVKGSNALKDIDLASIVNLVQQGVVGNLLEVESADGDTVRIFVE